MPDLQAENARLREVLARLEARLEARLTGESPDELTLDAVAGALPVLLFLFSEDDRYVDFRAGASPYVPPEAFLGRHIEEVLPPPVGAQFVEAMARCRASGLSERVDYTLPMEGEERRFEARVNALSDRRVVILATDVTELREAQRQLRHLVSLSPSVSYSLTGGPDGLVVSGASENFERVFGYRLADLATPGWWASAIHPDDLDSALGQSARVATEGRVVHQYRFRRSDGAWRWVRDEMLKVSDDGEPLEIAGAVSDVTVEHELEEQLMESRERFERAFADAPVGMAIVALDERFLAVNDALCRILGYPAARLLELTVPEVTHPDDLAVEAQYKAGLGRGTDSFSMEKRYLRADGSVVWGALSVSMVRDQAGQPKYLIGQLEDITERHEAIEALRRSEERFRELIENSPDLLAVFDHEGRIAYASPASLKMLGHTAGSLLGRPSTDVVDPEDAPRAMQLLGSLAQEPGATGRVELRMRRADGTPLVFDALVRNLLHVPTIAGYVVNARDITGERRLERQVRESQKLESVGRLAGGVAHDFNNLLVGILGYADLLEEGILAGHPSLDDLAEIRKAGERARDLTTQLLAIARRQVTEPRVVDVNDILHDSEKLLQRVLGEDIDLAVFPAPDPWPVLVDPSGIQQVVLNLAVNARDAMPLGGKLTIETANVMIEDEYLLDHADASTGPHVLVAVSDSGEGMTPEVMAHAFEPFFTTKPAGSGTGLGLATVYGIVRQAGGHIELYSEPGSGTTFKIYLPRTVGEPGARPGLVPPTERRGGTETILVAEDDAIARDLVVRVLEEAGYRVLAAVDGHDAIERARAAELPIDLLITDVVMPGLSGRQVAEAVSAARPTIKVLYASGYTESTIVHHGVLDPDIQFLPKPFTPAALLERTRVILDDA
jgi:PAS domain S-box-containing protein